MSRRPKLGDMLLDAPAAESPDPAPQGPDTAARPSVPGPAVTAVTAIRPPAEAPKRTAEPAAPGPRYLELIRKEARFVDEQLDDLATLTRQLNKARRGTGERITDNTLIRVAVDLLLARREDLAGTTEDELRKSVGL